MKTVVMEIPDWVLVPTSEIGGSVLIGKVVETWRDRIKVSFADKETTRVGIYTPSKHIFIEPTTEQWVKYAKYNGDLD